MEPITSYMAGCDDRIRHVKDKHIAYEVHVENEETASKGHFEVFVEVAIEQGSNESAESRTF